MYRSFGFPHLQNGQENHTCCMRLWWEPTRSHLCHQQHQPVGIRLTFLIVDLAVLEASCPTARGLSAQGSFGLSPPQVFLSSCLLPALYHSQDGLGLRLRQMLKKAESLSLPPKESGPSCKLKTHLQEMLKQQHHVALDSLIVSLSDEGKQPAEFLKGREHVGTALPSAGDALK